MPAKNAALTCYPTDETSDQFEELRQYYKKKYEGSNVRVTDSFILSEIIRQKFVDVRNRETQSLTLQRVYEQMQAHHQALSESLYLILAAVEKDDRKQGKL